MEKNVNCEDEVHLFPIWTQYGFLLMELSRLNGLLIYLKVLGMEEIFCAWIFKRAWPQ